MRLNIIKSTLFCAMILTGKASGLCQSFTTTITAVNAGPYTDSPIPIRISFGNEVSSYTPGVSDLLDVLIVGNATADNLMTSDNQVFDIDLTPITDGPVFVALIAGVAFDAMANSNLAAEFILEYDNGNTKSLSFVAGFPSYLQLLNSDGEYVDGQSIGAEFDNSFGIAVNSSNEIFVADNYNNRIRQIVGQAVTTYAGTGTFNTNGFDADGGLVNGPRLSAEFRLPAFVHEDNGVLYISDLGNQVIRQIDAAGNVSTLAGNGSLGADDGPTGSATFLNPRGMSTDPSGAVYVATEFRVRKIQSGQVTTILGPIGTVITDVHVLNDGNLLLSTGAGLLKYDIATESFDILFDQAGFTFTATENSAGDIFFLAGQSQALAGNTLLKLDGTDQAISIVFSNTEFPFLPFQTTRAAIRDMTLGADGKLYLTDSYNLIWSVDPVIAAIDDPPVFTNPIADFSVFEDRAPLILSVADRATDEDNDDADITYSITSNSNTALITTSQSGDDITFTIEPNTTGTASLTLTATSNGLTADNTFAITVEEPPPTLYSQTGTAENASSSQIFPDFGGSFLETAEDFVIPAGASWDIRSVSVVGSTNGTFSEARFTIYENNSGNVGVAVFTSPILSPEPFDFTGTNGAQNGNFRLTLDQPTTLAAGNYWISVQTNQVFSGGGGQWAWSFFSPATGDYFQVRDPDNLLSGAFPASFGSLGSNGSMIFSISGEEIMDTNGPRPILMAIQENPRVVQVTFDEEVSGFAAEDISGPTISNFTTIDAQTFTFQIEGTDDETIRIDEGAAADLVGNPTLEAIPLQIGTTSNNTLFFVGTQRTVDATIKNIYTGESIALNAIYNVNRNNVDGLSGINTYLASNSGDLMVIQDSIGNQAIKALNTFLLGNGNDIAILADSVYIYDGDVLIASGFGDDIVWAGTGDDMLFGAGDNDRLHGGPGNDQLSGELDDDILNGGSGDDHFRMGDGKDVATGGVGADRFEFLIRTEFDATLVDTLTDFSLAEMDTIDLRPLFTSDPTRPIEEYLSLEEVDGNTLLSIDTIDDGSPNFIPLFSSIQSIDQSLTTLIINGNLLVCDNCNLTSLDVVEACESYTWIDGNTYTSSNSTAVFSTTNTLGVTLDVALDLTILPAYSEPAVASICEGETFDFGSQTLTDAGDYTEIFTSIDGCDSTVNLTLSMLNTFDEDATASICEGETFDFGSQTLTDAGDYTEIFTSIDGCDSTVNLTLSVLDTFDEDATASICEGETFDFGSQSLTDAGNYTEVFTSVDGCDSTVNLTLSILAFEETATASICDGETFDFGSQTLTDAGDYTEVFTSIDGCDSTVNLTLSVLDTFDEAATASICEGETFDFGSQTLTDAGDYTEVFTSIDGCDSTVNLTLSVLETFDEPATASICEGENYDFGTQNLTDAGDYTEVFTSINGCDSTVNLTLTVLDTFKETAKASICEGETFDFGSQTLTDAGDYTEVFSSINGCDSTVNLTLTVLDTFDEAAKASICEGETFDFGSLILTDAGDYTEVFTSIDGCDSTVNLTLSVLDAFDKTAKASICEGETFEFGAQTLTDAGDYTELFTSIAGCDSTVNLTLSVLETFDEAATASICDGETFDFGSQTLTDAGDYTEVFSSTDGCDSTVNLTLSVLETFDETAKASICEGETFEFGAQTLTGAGDYTEIFTSIDGCDSTVNLTLTVLDTFKETAKASICEGETFDFGSQTLTDAGDYTEVFSSINGCDSTVNLTLTVLDTFDETAKASICEGETFEFGAQNLTDAGDYTEVFTSIDGCDSTVNLTLSVLETFDESATASICDGETFDFGSQNLTDAGDYTEVFTSIDGCDSTVNLTLSVLDTFEETAKASICEGETFDFGSQNLTDAGDYTEVFTSIDGCDSTVNLTLSVLETFDESATASICDGETFDFGSQNLTDAGDYTEVFTSIDGCDSTVNLSLSVLETFDEAATASICEGETYDFGSRILTDAGDYTEVFTSIAGCDSTVNLTLNIFDPSECEEPEPLSVANKVGVKLFPNPFSNGLFFTALDEQTYNYKLFDVAGTVVASGQVRGGEKLQTNFSPGTYFIQILKETEQVVFTRIVKIK